MKLEVYDFDKTIYDGDSSFDFFLYCLKQDKKLFFHIFKLIIPSIKYNLKIINITEFKEVIFSYLNKINDVDNLVNDFWRLNKNKIKDFYLKKDKKNHIIISASPYFLLNPLMDELNVTRLIASDVDKNTGKFNKKNCRGHEKVKRLKEEYKDVVIDKMYSDSLHDAPLLDLANKSYMVKKNNIYDYETYKENIIKRLYKKYEEIIKYIIAGVLTTIVSVGSYRLFTKLFNINYIISNILSWVLAVIFAYIVSRLFVFKSTNENKLKEFTTFASARVMTFILDTTLMILLVSGLKVDDFISKIIVQVLVVVSNYLISKFIVFK